MLCRVMTMVRIKQQSPATRPRKPAQVRGPRGAGFVAPPDRPPQKKISLLRERGIEG